MHQSDDVKARLDQIQRELLERECVDRASCYLPANDMASHFEQLERFNACMAQSKAANDERVAKLTTHRLTQILEVQERIAKAVETLVERGKGIALSSPKSNKGTLELTLGDLEWIQGWYEHTISTGEPVCREERDLMTKIAFKIAEVEGRNPVLFE